MRPIRAAASASPQARDGADACPRSRSHVSIVLPVASGPNSGCDPPSSVHRRHHPLKPGRARRRRFAVLATALLLGACSREPGPVARETRRLADEIAAAAGRPAAALEEIRGVRRIVLQPAVAEALLPAVHGLDIEEAGDHVEVSFRCPAALRGRPVAVAAGAAEALVSWSGVVSGRGRCPDGAGTPLRIRLPRLDGGAGALWIVRGLPQDRTDVPAITLHPGARLRTALGLLPLMPAAPLAAADFRVTATNATGQSATVLERRLDPRAAPADGDWVDVDLDLEPVRHTLGPEIRLTFEAADVGGEAGPATFPVWGDPTIEWLPADGVPPRRSVVLISLDTLRADRLGTYGARRPTTPALDALAAESTLFETAIAPAPWTLPSHTSMMTGLPECVHGMSGTIGKPFPAGLVPLAQRLRRAGYATAAFTEDGFVDATSFTRGFAYYRENRSGVDRAPTTVAHALEWLRTHSAQPFFLFVHTYQAHEPYFAAPPYADMFADRHDTDGLRAVNPQDLAKYDAAVRYTDAAITPLLEALRAAPDNDRTLLVVTSDHGEGLGERGYVGHGRSLHEEVLHVPLLIHAPGLVATGRRVPGLVGVIDVTPTILDLVGLPVPAGITGTSLAPQALASARPAPVPERALFIENNLDHYRLAIRWPRWKATWDDGGPVITDLEHDPAERAPVRDEARAGAAAAERERFEQMCQRERAELEAAGAALQVPQPALPDPARERQLKALGYLK